MLWLILTHANPIFFLYDFENYTAILLDYLSV